MARYNGPVCRLCRRNGTKLFLKGERCHTPRCAVERRRTPPGDQAAHMLRRRMSEHGIQLREKQKARYVYGILERQFKNYIDKANRMPGVTGDRLIELLERRLDNVIYRLGFGDSRNQARQLVLHGHFRVNGRRVSIPSFLVKVGDEVTWRPQSKDSEFYKTLAEAGPTRSAPEWLALDRRELAGTVVSVPEPPDEDPRINTRLIVEFYSRR